MYDLNERLLLLSSDIAVDETLYLDCVVCGEGGRTLAVTKFDDRVVYVCHRDTCNTKGVIRRNSLLDGPLFERPAKPSVAAKFNKTIKELSSIPLAVASVLENNWGITTQHIARGEWLWHVKSSRLWMPYKDIVGRTLGGVLRSIDPEVKKMKAITVPADEGLFRMCWYSGPNSRVVVVEDPPSALRASRYVSSCALLGTSLNDDTVAAIRKTRPAAVVICLDYDAYNKGLETQRKYSYLFESCYTIRPPKDLKDMKEGELQAFLSKEVLDE